MPVPETEQERSNRVESEWGRGVWLWFACSLVPGWLWPVFCAAGFGISWNRAWFLLDEIRLHLVVTYSVVEWAKCSFLLDRVLLVTASPNDDEWAAPHTVLLDRPSPGFSSASHPTGVDSAGLSRLPQNRVDRRRRWRRRC